MSVSPKAPKRIAVHGAAGRMGQTVCAAVDGAPDLELVARIDVGEDVATAVRESGADVAIDFTVPSVTEANVHAALDGGAHVVVGTTGWDDESRARVSEHLERLRTWSAARRPLDQGWAGPA